MHNKSFTVDSQFTIVGGRNLADEYFQSSQVNEFLDEDLLAIGNVVTDVSTGFDEYWNTRESTPIESLRKAQVLPSIDEMMREGRRFIAAHSETHSLVSETRKDRLVPLKGSLPLVPAEAKLILDHPDKVRRRRG